MPVQLAIATSAAYPTIHPDDAHLAASLAALDIQPQACVWNDPAIDWTRFDAVLIRTIWDYFEHYDAFLAWLRQLEHAGVPAINPVALMRWNSDKRYLLQLEALGVPTIPTQLVSRAVLHEALAASPGRDVVVKPCVSGGAWRTVRGTVGDPAFDRAASELPPGEYLLQPFVPAIVEDGEWSLLFFGGKFSHAVIKRPAAGDYRVQSQFGGRTDAIEPDAATLAAARHALATCATLGNGDAEYARVDGVVVDGQFLLMELELIEPFLFLAGRPDAAERNARVIAARLESLQTSKAGHRTENA
ncbi:ATP-grasp domain-containing protein [Dyella agri]|uniref:Prokaryotic glutathione synthetase ATP-binding domain-containing protein n=1 Tax=Dyella agri TaxID=1926869 RepID=A0ABW8KJM9_9GAMM